MRKKHLGVLCALCGRKLQKTDMVSIIVEARQAQGTNVAHDAYPRLMGAGVCVLGGMSDTRNFQIVPQYN